MVSSLRYDRQRIIDKWDQSKLSKAKVVLIGAGALGNHIGAGIIGLGIGNIEIFDFDRIEIHNLNRQSLFIEDDIGRNKAEALANRLVERNSEIRIRGYGEKLTEANIPILLDSPDLIIDAVDDVSTRIFLSRYAIMKNIPLIHGATSADGGQVGTITRKTPCIECFMNPEKGDLENQSCIKAPEPSVVYSTQIISGLMIESARIVLLPLTISEIPIPPLIYYDTNAPGRFYQVKLKRKSDCICNDLLKDLKTN